MVEDNQEVNLSLDNHTHQNLSPPNEIASQIRSHLRSSNGILTSIVDEPPRKSDGAPLRDQDRAISEVWNDIKQKKKVQFSEPMRTSSQDQSDPIDRPKTPFPAGSVSPETTEEVHGCDCTISRQQESLRNDLQTLYDGWRFERRQHAQTSLNAERLQRLVDACDATFKCMSFQKEGPLSSGVSLSMIASQALATHLDSELHKQLQEESAVVAVSKAQLKRKAKYLVRSTQHFSHFASALRSEMDSYAEWLEEKSRIIEANHARYCEIMMEHGTKPEMLYWRRNDVACAREAFLKAYDNRLEAARLALENAYFDCVPDMFEDSYNI